jgi:hypothetical protein
MQPVSCGTIDRAPDVVAVPEQMSEDAPAPEPTAVLAGICLAKGGARPERSPDPSS